MTYIKITNEQYNTWQGVVKDDVKVFNAVATIHGYYVCDANTLGEFPEAFASGVEYVDLTENDFPQYDIL